MMTQEELTRAEELSKLESLHKKALSSRVEDYHRSTKTTIKRFQGLHLRLRENHRFYRAWHNFRFASIVHWILLFTILGTLGTEIYNSMTDISKSKSLPSSYVVIAGNPMQKDLKATAYQKSNIKINKDGFYEIEDPNVEVGFIKFRANTKNLAQWQIVSWRADTPGDSSIVYRMRTTKGTEAELDKATWSDYYPVSGKANTQKGIPVIKSRIIDTEIVFQKRGDNLPKLYRFEFGYTPFIENNFLIAVKDRLVSWISDLFTFFMHKEGIYSK